MGGRVNLRSGGLNHMTDDAPDNKSEKPDKKSKKEIAK
jgi:hypothetical protein